MRYKCCKIRSCFYCDIYVILHVGSVACVHIIVHKKIIILYLFRNLGFVFILQLGEGGGVWLQLFETRKFILVLVTTFTDVPFKYWG